MTLTDLAMYLNVTRFLLDVNFKNLTVRLHVLSSMLAKVQEDQILIVTGTDPLRDGGPFLPPPLPSTISLKNFSILEDSYFRVNSWPPSNFWIGPNSPKETNHLTLSLGLWPLHSPNIMKQRNRKSPIS